jgi:hypothetical protein
MEWFFNGIGTMLLGLILGAAGGGIVGYKFGFSKSKVDQAQKAEGNARQIQVGEKSTNKRDSQTFVRTGSYNQSQEATDNATQIQIGSERKDG